MSAELLTRLEEFVCALYGSRHVTDVNDLRYAMFCAKRGKIESHQLPPCRDTLQKHSKRANYQALIWRKCLEGNPFIPEPEQHGWIAYDDELSIDWMSGKPAPQAVLEFMSCDCTRSCTVNCQCVSNGLKCTDMCRLAECENRETVDMDEETLSDTDDNEEEEEEGEADEEE